MKSIKQLIIVLFALFLINCGNDKVDNIQDFTTLVQTLEQKNNDINAKQQEIQEIIKKYNETVPDDKKIDFTFSDTTQGLNIKQKQILEEMLKQEKDVSYTGLLKEIIRKNDEIATLKEELFKIQQKLPKPYDVKRGDTHYKVCLKYLTEVEKLDKNKADELIDRVRLIDELVPGFQVWLFYKDDVFGTYVTQGTAKISPNQFARITRKQAIEKAMNLGKQSVYDSLNQAKTITDTTAIQQENN